jgi:hypothetical protein
VRFVQELESDNASQVQKIMRLERSVHEAEEWRAECDQEMAKLMNECDQAFKDLTTKTSEVRKLENKAVCFWRLHLYIAHGGLGPISN